MNIMYCGDRNIADGLMISVLSLCKNVTEPLNIFVLTMSLRTEETEAPPHECSAAERAGQMENASRGAGTEKREVRPVPQETVRRLDEELKKRNSGNSIRLLDLTENFRNMPPTANMETRFTPCCMLRLYADQIPEIPDRILYLDTDVVCRRDCSSFYHQNMEGVELAGVLDYYGKWFFRNRVTHMDYMNSGVLLLNMEEIRRTGLFARCRERCRDKKMFMPDQSALNKLAVSKKICARKYNEQRILKKDTVLQHFSTSFRFFPWIHTVTIKPWQIDKMHKELKLTEYDDILEEYQRLRMEDRTA